MAMMSFRIQKYFWMEMNGALLNFLNFFLHFIAFFLLLHVFCEKKQNTRARLFSLARRETTKIGPHDAHRWKRCASEFFSARNHPRVGRVVRTLPVVQRDLRKDAFRVTDSKKGVPKRRKMRSTSALKIKQTCLDVVKENPPKKPSRDPRRLASNSRLAVSLGTRDSLDDDDSYDERARRACILHRGDIFKFVRSSVFLFKRADIIMCTPLFFKTTTTDTSRLANSPPALVLVPRSTWPPSWNT